MEIRDLRIGNLIYHDWIDKNSKLNNTIGVYGIMSNFVILDDNRLPDYLSLHINDVKPIPLTEEWLLKFGWNKKDGAWYNRHLSLMLIGGYNHFKLFSVAETGGEWFIASCSTVHKLQNLNYLLEDEELTIK